MKKRAGINFVIVCLLVTIVSGCSAMAELFHGPKPEAPPVTYTVTYHANGGSGAVPAAQSVSKGTTITIAGQGGLVYAGNIFGGWNTLANGTGTPHAAGSSMTVNGNITLYAQWVDSSTPQYTVTFNANGASGSPPAPQTVNSGISITIPDKGTLVFTGKTFNGWNTLANGTGTPHAAGSSMTVNGNITLYAQWAAVTDDARSQWLSRVSAANIPELYISSSYYTAPLAKVGEIAEFDDRKARLTALVSSFNSRYGGVFSVTSTNLSITLLKDSIEVFTIRCRQQDQWSSKIWSEIIINPDPDLYRICDTRQF
jgi:uncharacterized repeat protein (TIGR02543 family)